MVAQFDDEGAEVLISCQSDAQLNTRDRTDHWFLFVYYLFLACAACRLWWYIVVQDGAEAWEFVMTRLYSNLIQKKIKTGPRQAAGR